MNTFINNVLFFSGEIKRSKSDGKAMGNSRDMGKIGPLRGASPGGGNGEKGEVKKVKTNLVG